MGIQRSVLLKRQPCWVGTQREGLLEKKVDDTRGTTAVAKEEKGIVIEGTKTAKVTSLQSTDAKRAREYVGLITKDSHQQSGGIHKKRQENTLASREGPTRVCPQVLTKRRWLHCATQPKCGKLGECALPAFRNSWKRTSCWNGCNIRRGKGRHWQTHQQGSFDHTNSGDSPEQRGNVRHKPIAGQKQKRREEKEFEGREIRRKTHGESKSQEEPRAEKQQQIQRQLRGQRQRRVQRLLRGANGSSGAPKANIPLKLFELCVVHRETSALGASSQTHGAFVCMCMCLRCVFSTRLQLIGI